MRIVCPAAVVLDGSESKIGDKIAALVGVLRPVDMTLSREAAALGVGTFADDVEVAPTLKRSRFVQSTPHPELASSPLTVTSRLQNRSAEANC